MHYDKHVKFAIKDPHSDIVCIQLIEIFFTFWFHRNWW